MNAPRRWSPTTKRAVVIVVVAVALLLVVRLGDIVRPFIWAFVVAYVLQPAVAFLQQRSRLHRAVASSVVFAALAAAIFGIGFLFAPVAAREMAELRRALPEVVRSAQTTAAEWLPTVGLGDLNPLVFAQGTTELTQTVARAIVPVAVALGQFTLELLIFLIVVFFLLRDAPRLFEWARSLIPTEERREFLPLIGQVSSLLARYIRGQMLLVLIMWTVTSVGLALLGVPYAIVLGFLTGVLELIPIAGPISAGAIATIVALGNPNPFGWSQLAYVGVVIAMYTVLRHAEDYFVIPLVIGRIVRLHPLVVIISLLAGGALFGLLGILLAVPATATIRLVLVYVGAKLRDEDPFPQLEHEIEAIAAAPIAAPEARAARGQAGP